MLPNWILKETNSEYSIKITAKVIPTRDLIQLWFVDERKRYQYFPTFSFSALMRDHRANNSHVCFTCRLKIR